ncbi:hypothetical protein MMC13_001130 [Lambiella insularis]|nr:hypothetical protein [Lambiella insularis]
MSISIDTNTWYRLTNAQTGLSIALDAVNTGMASTQGPVQMDGVENVYGQYWHIAVQPSGYFHFSTLYLGERMILDTLPIINNSTPRLNAASIGSTKFGQQWSVSAQGDGSFKFSNDAAGATLFLEVCSNTNELCFDGGDSPAQHWTVAEIEKINPTDPAYSSTSQTPGSAATTSILSVPASTREPAVSIVPAPSVVSVSSVAPASLSSTTWLPATTTIFVPASSPTATLLLPITDSGGGGSDNNGSDSEGAASSLTVITPLSYAAPSITTFTPSASYNLPTTSSGNTIISPTQTTSVNPLPFLNSPSNTSTTFVTSTPSATSATLSYASAYTYYAVGPSSDVAYLTAPAQSSTIKYSSDVEELGGGIGSLLVLVMVMVGWGQRCW